MWQVLFQCEACALRFHLGRSQSKSIDGLMSLLQTSHSDEVQQGSGDLNHVRLIQKNVNDRDVFVVAYQTRDICLLQGHVAVSYWGLLCISIEVGH